MCQAKSDGGRRCPIHRHDSVAVISMAVKNTGLTKTQVEHTFRELTREGRGAEKPTDEQWSAFTKGIRENLPEDGQEVVTRNLDKAEQHSSAPDGKTFYALTKISERAKARNTNFNSLIERVAQEKGYSTEHVREQFNKSYEDAKRAYGEGRPDGYSASAYAWAKNNSLPYDTQSVVAINSIRELPARSEGAPRVERVSTGLSTLTEIGYNADGGRLEVTLGSSGIVAAYRNVPIDVYETLVQNGHVTRQAEAAYESIRSNPEYLYDSAKQAEVDSEAIKCAGCGQFASPVGHTCPAVASSDPQLASTTLPTEGDTESNQTDPSEEPVIDDSGDVPVYDPANPKPIWGSHENKPLYRLAENVPEDEIYAMAGFSEIGDSEEVVSCYFADIVFAPSDLRQFRNMHAYTMDDIPNKEDIYDEIESSLLDGKAVSVVLAERRIQPSGTYGYSDQDSETGILSLEEVNDYGEMNQWAHAQSRSYMCNGAAELSSLNPEIKLYEIDRSGKFYSGLYPETAQNIRENDTKYLDLRASYTRTITLDAENKEVEPTLRIPTKTHLRNAVNTTDRFYMPVAFASNPRNRYVIDDQGYMVSYSDMNIEGYIEYKKDDEGKWAAVPNGRSLKCYCEDYRQSYNCHHMDVVARKADNILYQSGAFDEPERRSANRIDLSQLDNGEFLTPALARRGDLTITPPNEKTGEALHYTFNSFAATAGARSRQYSWFRNNDMSVFFDKVGEINSYQDYLKYRDAMDIRYQVYDFYSTDKPREVEQALKKGGTATVPVSASILSDNSRPQQVSGTVDLTMSDEGSVSVKGHSLKCECEEYKENYDCAHVRATVLNSAHIPYIGQRNYEPDSDDRKHRQRNSLLVRGGEKIYEYRRMGHFQDDNPKASEKELRQMMADEDAAMRERELQQIALRRERHEEEQRRRREMYKNIAKQHRKEAEEFKEANPEYAKALDEHRQNLVTKWESTESSYVEDKEKVEGAMKDALRRKRNGEDAVPFRVEGGVLDGASEGIAGRKFGVELEFEIKRDVDRNQAIRNIAEDLYQAGLTNSEYQQGYHSAMEDGYSAWSFEEDETVDGELVSPILDDSPESWRQLKVATDIITKHGGIATTNAGSHVHVSTGSYETNAAKSAELLRLSKDFEDVTYRLASDPSRGKHRGTRWCQPNVKDKVGDLDHDDHETPRNDLGAHYHENAVNFDNLSSELNKSNAEFRVWDATLNPGVIQAQVMMSVALTDRAEYNVLKNGKSVARSAGKGIESSIGYNRNNDTSHEETHNEGGIAQFLDTMFRRDEDKNHIASLFAVTKWQESDENNDWDY